jgi:DNA-binding transcriptional ArsR family regulator
MQSSNRPSGDTPPTKRALAHPTRVEILDCLTRSRDRTGMGAQEIAAALGLSADRLAYHLRVLSDAGLIAGLGEGRGGRVEGANLTRRGNRPGAS